MASFPNFDSNMIVKKPNKKYWDSLINNALSPLTDRSVQGLYAPGSTFKMIVAIAALKFAESPSGELEFERGTNKSASKQSRVEKI